MNRGFPTSHVSLDSPITRVRRIDLRGTAKHPALSLGCSPYAGTECAQTDPGDLRAGSFLAEASRSAALAPP